MDNKYKEVHYHRYCVTCKHRSLKETEEPCDYCLDNPVNLNSHKPVRYEKKQKG